jgi:hypothetical protein
MEEILAMLLLPKRKHKVEKLWKDLLKTEDSGEHPARYLQSIAGVRRRHKHESAPSAISFVTGSFM